MNFVKSSIEVTRFPYIQLVKLSSNVIQNGLAASRVLIDVEMEYLMAIQTLIMLEEIELHNPIQLVLMDIPLRTLSSVSTMQLGCLLKGATLDSTAPPTQVLWVITTTVLGTQRERTAVTACARLFQVGNALISSTRCFEEKLILKSHYLDLSVGRLQTQPKVLIDVGFSQKTSTISVDTCIILPRGTITSYYLRTTMNFRKMF